LSLLRRVDKIATVELIIHDEEERWEHYDSVPEPLSIPPDIDYEIFDGILINMINGRDISLEELSSIREKFDGPVYFDVHTLSRGIGRDNHRYFRKIPDSEEWFSNLNIVQANEHEILTFCESDDEKYIAEWTLNLGVSNLVVTKGNNGAAWYTLDETGQMKEKIFKGESYSSVNKVGCGDIFGATVFCNFLAGSSFSKSIVLANRAAGLVTTFTDTDQYFSIKEKLGIV
jgi:sugar/nucleoside kinase (ribokinase family)